MRDSNFEQLPRPRQLAISGWALAALLAALLATNAASASTLTPTISGTPPTSVRGWHTYKFTPTARGPRGYTLRFSISGKPSWATFSTGTGTLSGTPKTANVGTSTTVVIRVSDGVASASLAPFTLRVLPNITPTLSGTPPGTASVGIHYSFTPKASEPDGDPLSFSVKNKPAWASFSIATGTISGTPAAANVGTYSNIVISASTGYASASLAPFAITVTQPSGSGSGSGTTGTAKLTWSAPTTNANGSGLTDLAGYHIYYGNSPSSMTKTITVANPATTSYTVSDLASGTWYFAVNAYTTTGLDSALSNTGSKTIP
ncbi:MAG: putative Ig domain-containing protein [Steroidobacteraceae bacterium]